MKKHAGRIIASILAAGIMAASLTACSKSQIEDAVNIALSDPAKVSLVKNGHFEGYPDKAIGDAFNDFFATPTWQEFTADTGEQVVEFNGYFMYMDNETRATIQFEVDEDAGTFSVCAIAFNDVPQNLLMQAALLQKVYGEE